MVDREEVDASINTMALINVLVLTLPTALMGNMQISSWDSVYVAAFGDLNRVGVICNESDVAFESILERIANVILVTCYLTILSLLLTVFYYVLRPASLSLAENIEDDNYNNLKENMRDDEVDDAVSKSVTSHFWLNYERYKKGKAVYTFDDLKNANDIETEDDNEKDEQKKVKALRERRNWKDPLQLLHAEVAMFKFRVWWSRGRVIFIIVFFSTITSVILAICIANLFYSVLL
jgi:hypothetical protein